MSAGAKVVSEMLMLILSMLAAPGDLREFRLDMIGPSGRIETLTVKRNGSAYDLYTQQGAQLVKTGTLRPADGKKDVYLLKIDKRPEQTFDLSTSLKNFSAESLRKASQLELTTNDKAVIHVYRSGNVVYLTPEKGRVTYACH